MRAPSNLVMMLSFCVLLPVTYLAFLEEFDPLLELFAFLFALFVLEALLEL